MSVNVKYRTSATTVGGRDGNSRTEDGQVEIRLATPKELGGPGGASNPEQLFAMGYSACFLSALKVAGQQLKVRVPDATTVTASVGIGPRLEGGFGLVVDIVVKLPNLESEIAEKLVETADKVCPYSNAIRGNVDVTFSIA